MSKCTMESRSITVRGSKRNVWIRSAIDANKWRARTYVDGKTVSGILQLYKSGSYRFTPDGKNASLLK